MRDAPPRFVAIGHVTHDRLDAGIVPGGSALYAALAAAEMGARARLVTSAGPDFVGEALLAAAGVELERDLAEHTTTFVNRYESGRRSQRVLAVAGPLVKPAREADVVLVCPVIGEVAPSALVAPPGAVLGAGLQGWLRAVDEATGAVVRRVPDDVSWLGACHALFMSEEDLGADAPALLERLLGLAEIVVVTEGAHGARMYVDRRPHRIAPYPTHEIDPTGAGDVFAAAFLLALVATRSPFSAAAVAACAGAVAVEEIGPGALPRLAQLEVRVAWYRKNVLGAGPKGG